MHNCRKSVTKLNRILLHHTIAESCFFFSFSYHDSILWLPLSWSWYGLSRWNIWDVNFFVSYVILFELTRLFLFCLICSVLQSFFNAEQYTQIINGAEHHLYSAEHHLYGAEHCINGAEYHLYGAEHCINGAEYHN